jgi:co-chaperonin GroES (HSP10)
MLLLILLSSRGNIEGEHRGAKGDYMSKRNKEGYPDSTAVTAIGNVFHEQKEKVDRKNGDRILLINMIKQIVHFAGYEVVGRIQLKDRTTGKEYR